MRYSLALSVPPTVEPVSLAAAREQCGIDGFEHDGALAAYILAARQHVEAVCGLALCTQSFTMTLDAFPDAASLALPRYPIRSIDAIRYVDSGGVTRVWSSADWQAALVGERPRIAPLPPSSWPGTRDVFDAVTIEFTAGYGASQDVPTPISQAIRLLVAHYFENREAVLTGSIVATFPFAVDALLAPYRRYAA